MNLPGLDLPADLPRYTASIALATLAGFVFLVSPGGLGVREAALAELMLPYLQGIGMAGKAALLALVSAALLRLVWLVSEIVVSVILYGVGLRKAAGGEIPPSPPEAGAAAPGSAPPRVTP
jgi:uncharacterized membrane protein YbhN (UPF0104 family)